MLFSGNQQSTLGVRAADDPQAGVNEINAERSLRHIYELSAWLVMRGCLPKAGRTPAVPLSLQDIENQWGFIGKKG